jgi:hypothetical protein
MATRHSWSKDSLGTPIFGGGVGLTSEVTAVSGAAMVMEKNQDKHRGLNLHSKAITKVWGQFLTIIYSKFTQDHGKGTVCRMEKPPFFPYLQTKF